MWSLLSQPGFAFSVVIICSAINNENRCFIALFIVKRKRGTGKFPCPAWSFIHNSELCSLNFSGSQTRSTYIHLLCTAVSCFNFNGFYIGFPHFIGSSMGMTYIISEISTFFTNCAFSHDSTSLTLFFQQILFYQMKPVFASKKNRKSQNIIQNIQNRLKHSCFQTIFAI